LEEKIIPASIRIIKIVKDKNPMTGEESEAYTVEFECEAENARDLPNELASSILGQRAMDLIQRAEFLPEGTPTDIELMKQQAEKEAEELKKREEQLREEGRREVRKKYLDYIAKKRKNSSSSASSSRRALTDIYAELEREYYGDERR